MEDGKTTAAIRHPPSAIVFSPKRKWLFRLSALVLLPLLLLGGLEAALRLTGYGYDTHLFKKLRIGREDFLVNNDTFGLRFFPPELARFPGECRMAARKPAGTYRIFILGESAAMGDPEPAYGASRYLEALLAARFPDAHFEVINTGITAINSHVILPIARDCARHDGDLWIIYMGNNEMVGPFGAITVFGAQAPPLPVVRLNLALKQFRLGQWLAEAGHKLTGKKSDATSWGGMEMFAGNRIASTDTRKEAVYQNFQRNLRDILQAGLDSGASILLNTVAVNLKDCPPFASVVDSNLPAAERAALEKLFAEGRQIQGKGNFARAAEVFEQAAKLDADYADLQFHWGDCLLRSGNSNARGHLQRACDVDTLPFRTDTRINRAITETAQQLASDKLVLLDAAATLAGSSPDGVCGEESFYEHVHFNFDGNYRLAHAWARQTERFLPATVTARATGAWASQENCEHRLGLSDWNRVLVFQHVLGRFSQPPLNGQSNNARRIEALQGQVARLRQQMNTNTAAQVRADFAATLQQSPDDFMLRENFALFLQSIGDLPQATVEWRRVHELIPHDYLAHFQLGRLLALQGQWAEAESSLQQAVKLHPTLTEGWLELGHIHAAQEKFAPALAAYEHARKQRPHDPQPVFRTGKVLAKLNRPAEAMQKYRDALQLQPDLWEAHFELGGALDAAGELSGAQREFAEAARLQPENPRPHFNLGVLLAKQNQFDAAQHEFEETLRLEPGNKTAQTYLAQVRELKNKKP